VQSVDSAQPVAAANAFYSDLRSGNIEDALARFAPEFKAKEDHWPRLLRGLQQRYGPVTAAELRDSSLAGIGDDPCFSLTYSVKRRSLSSTEAVFLCSKRGKAPWLIRGERLTRQDTNQSIIGGVVPEEASIHAP